MTEFHRKIVTETKRLLKNSVEKHGKFFPNMKKQITILTRTNCSHSAKMMFVSLGCVCDNVE